MDWTLFATFLAACVAAGATGMIFKPGDWYLSLTKPTWTPPAWAFPVVWTVLYVSMAYAATRVAGLAGNGQAMALWAVQIALNTLWTPVFFGARRMRAGMGVIGALWLAVAGTMVAFFALDLIAGLLFLPYLVWVSIAAALNLMLIRLNPAEAKATTA